MASGNDSSNILQANFAPWQGEAAYAFAFKQRENLLRRMTIVAKARFNAHARLNAKASATNVGLQLANLYTIAISILIIQFRVSSVIDPLERVLNYVSLLASVFVQIMALIESFKDYSGKAKAMHHCAMQVNRLVQRLELEGRMDLRTLQDYSERYNAIIIDIDVNHDNIDYQRHVVEQDIKALKEARNRGREKKARKTRDDVGAGEASGVSAASGKRKQSQNNGTKCEIPDRLGVRVRQVYWSARHLLNIYALTTVIVLSPWLVLLALLGLDIR